MPVTPQNDAGWRIEPPVSVPVLAGIRRAATATALAPDEPPGMWSRFHGLRTGSGLSWPTAAIGRVFVRRTHGEFVAVELAQRHRALFRQSGDHGGVERRAVALQHARAGGAGEVAGDEDVLVRQRHAFERAGVAAGQALRRPRGPGPA